jgi:hypothetical protein
MSSERRQFRDGGNAKRLKIWTTEPRFSLSTPASGGPESRRRALSPCSHKCALAVIHGNNGPPGFEPRSNGRGREPCKTALDSGSKLVE